MNLKLGSRRSIAMCSIALVAAVTAAGVAPFTPTARATVSPSTKVVTAFGYSVRVPGSWPVYDLGTEPSRCVRFDVDAVYLGHPGPDQRCPSRVLGSADALLIEPLDGSASARTGAVQADAGRPVPVGTGETDARRIDLVVPDAHVRVTATFSSDASLVRGILQGATLTASGSSPTATPAPAPTVDPTPPADAVAPDGVAPRASTRAATNALTANRLSGYGFDTCGLPSLSTMSAWTGTSPYHSVGVYLGGTNWGCRSWSSAPTASWFSTVSGAGWGVLPIWVGLQAPGGASGCRSCVTMSMDPSTAWSQGANEASQAIGAAQAAGIAPGVMIAFDMENWNTTNSAANVAVVAFLSAWTATLHASLYPSSVFTSSCSGGDTITAALGTTGPYAASGASGTFTAPDYMWFARWRYATAPTSLLGITCIPDNTWVGTRGLQYQGGTDVTFGGQTLNVDSNLFDPEPTGPVDLGAYVNGVIRALLGRPPASLGELATWMSYLQAGNSPAAFVERIVTGTEYTVDTVDADYATLLQREPDPAGGAFWATRLAQTGRNDLIVASIAGSSEYFNGRSSSDISTFVTNLYRDLLGRAVDPSGLAYWSNQLSSQALDRAALALSLADSNEYAQHLVAAQYQIVLGRMPDPAGAAYWANRYVATHDILQLVVSLASSPEGITRLQGI
ncbi:MAG: DUF4214 domain-containing protein [Actinobacteria bacterium]|nr:DUF4214 domain-containing protein [Actinomycetota bacterium]